MTGEPVTADEPIHLRSVQRAAFAAWTRKQSIPIDFGLISTSAPFSIRSLLAADAGVPGHDAPLLSHAVQPQPAELAASSGAIAITGVGIDIEDVAALPVTSDYREHEFYRRNFTAVEIAYCVRQPDPRTSFCGTWAAKEAVLKSGLAVAPSGRLDAIEITRDARGRPDIAGGQLSISHTATTAVAVCIALATASRPAAGALPFTAQPTVAGADAPSGVVKASADRAVGKLFRIWVPALCLALILAGGAATLLHIWL